MKLAGYYSATKTVSSSKPMGFPQPYTALQPQDPLAQTIRLNLDTTLTPTLLLHIGAGYLHTSNPQSAPAYDQKGLFPNGVPFTASNYFPYIAGMYSPIYGGWSGGGPYPAVVNTGVAFYRSRQKRTIISRRST